MSVGEQPRRIDRHRRERILEGALEVIGTHGVESLTHRRVAEAAGVPLAATTYYFSSMEELLLAALNDWTERDLVAVRARFEAMGTETPLSRMLAEFIVDACTQQRRRNTLVETELYTAAMRRDGIRQAALAWEREWVRLLGQRIGTFAAPGVSALIGGLIQHALLEDEPPALDSTEALLRWFLREDG